MLAFFPVAIASLLACAGQPANGPCVFVTYDPNGPDNKPVVRRIICETNRSRELTHDIPGAAVDVAALDANRCCVLVLVDHLDVRGPWSLYIVDFTANTWTRVDKDAIAAHTLLFPSITSAGDSIFLPTTGGVCELNLTDGAAKQHAGVVVTRYEGFERCGPGRLVAITGPAQVRIYDALSKAWHAAGVPLKPGETLDRVMSVSDNGVATLRAKSETPAGPNTFSIDYRYIECTIPASLEAAKAPITLECRDVVLSSAWGALFARVGTHTYVQRGSEYPRTTSLRDTSTAQVVVPRLEASLTGMDIWSPTPTATPTPAQTAPAPTPATPAGK